MARVVAHKFHERWHWHGVPSNVWHTVFVAALWLVIISLGVFLIGSVIMTLTAALIDMPYLRGGGGMGAAVPLGLLALFTTFAFWLPLFMPFLIPVALLVTLLFLPFSDLAKEQYTKVFHEAQSIS